MVLDRTPILEDVGDGLYRRPDGLIVATSATFQHYGHPRVYKGVIDRRRTLDRWAHFKSPPFATHWIPVIGGVATGCHGVFVERVPMVAETVSEFHEQILGLGPSHHEGWSAMANIVIERCSQREIAIPSTQPASSAA